MQGESHYSVFPVSNAVEWERDGYRGLSAEIIRETNREYFHLAQRRPENGVLIDVVECIYKQNNHLIGAKCKALKITFANLADLIMVRKSLFQIVRKNQKSRSLLDGDWDFFGYRLSF
jgi:hypothetical protein